jgi:PAS domain S-box-containing protein
VNAVVPGLAGYVKATFSHWHRADPAGEVDSRLMARSLGVVGAIGCSLVLVWDALPSPPHTDHLALAILALIGLATGLVLASGTADEAPPTAFEGAVLLATTLTSLGVYFVHMRGSALVLFYLWCTPYAYWFFPRPRALLQALLVVVAFSLAKVVASLTHPALAGPLSEDWGPIALLAGTVLVSGELVYRMRVRINESQSRFERIFHGAPTPMARVGADLRYIDANPAFCAALGRERAEVVGAHAYDFVAEDDRERIRQATDGLFAGRRDSVQLERDYARPDGTRVSLLTNVSMLGDAELGTREAFVQGLDLSERKRAEEALAASEQRYRTLVETAQAIVWASDPDGTLTFVNDAVRKVLGYEPEELLGRSLVVVLPEEHRLASAEMFARLRHRGTISGEAAHRRKDGSTIIGTFSVAAQRNEAGEVSGFAGTVIDVTERRRAEEALRVSEERLRALIDNAPAVITVRDPDGRLTVVNREMARLLGVEPEELLGRSIDDLHPPDQAEAYRQFDAIVRETGEPVVHDITHRLGDGEHVFLTVAFPLPSARDEPPMICRIAVDVTDRERARHALVRSNEERRRLLAELVRAQEDERRRIAADVHDESIQVLAGVAIRLGLLSGMLDRPEQQRLIAGLDESVRRGIKSLRQLLFDLRLPALDELGLAAAIRSYLEETVAPEGTSYVLEDRLETEPPAELRTVLYRIAQEALSNVRKHAHAHRVEVVLEGSLEGFMITVRDDGVGFEQMPEEAPGHLGIVGMRERVEAAGGWIEVRSEPGQGTTVEFGVPAGAESSAEVPVGQEHRG